MSVYYNLTKHANNIETQDARFEAFGGDGAVVKNPSDYSVGVNRFKIPLGTIPVYRFYDKEFNFSNFFAGQSTIPSSFVREGRPDLSLAKSNLFDGDQIFASYGRFGIDTQNGNKKFKDVFSQEDIVEQLNQAHVRALSNVSRSGSNLMNGTNHVQPSTSDVSLGSNLSVGGETAVITFSVPANVSSTKQNNTGSIIVGLELVIKRINSTDANFDFSMFDFFLQRTSNVAGITDTNTFPLVIGQFEGMSTFDGNTFGSGHNQISWGSTHKHQIGSSMCKDTTLIDAYRIGVQKPSDEPFNVYIEDTNLEGVMGKRYDGYDYVLTCKNKTFLNNSTQPMNAEIYSGEIELKFYTINLSGIDNNVYTQPTPPLRQNAMLMPYFTLEDDGKIAYNINTSYILGYQIRLYMNNALYNLFSFNEYKTREITQLNKTLVMTDTSSLFTDEDVGVVLSFVGNIEKRVSNGRVQLGDNLQFKEGFNTSFARDFLNGIVISTGAIAIDGEIVADGDSKRRILTDFTIDPSTTSRDYLVFSNQGGMRFYNVKSTEPLRRVDVQVSYQDIYGKIRPLLIKPSQELSIKLEFRPNTQLYSLDGQYSSFQTSY